MRCAPATGIPHCGVPSGQVCGGAEDSCNSMAFLTVSYTQRLAFTEGGAILKWKNKRCPTKIQCQLHTGKMAGKWPCFGKHRSTLGGKSDFLASTQKVKKNAFSFLLIFRPYSMSGPGAFARFFGLKVVGAVFNRKILRPLCNALEEEGTVEVLPPPLRYASRLLLRR